MIPYCMRGLGLVGVLTLLSGCADQPPPSESATDPAPPAAAEAPATARAAAPANGDDLDLSDALSGLEADVSGMDLYMHDIEPTGDARRKPTLWVHAAEGQLKADNSWALANARAVIYRENEADIQLESTSGRFDEANKVAVLDGGVKVAAGDVELSTDSVSYDNHHRIVRTHAPVKLSDGDTVLNADEATLEPKDGVVILSNVSGMLSLDGELQ